MGVPPKSQETTMLSWSLLTVPHGDTSLMLAVTTATPFAQLGIALAQQGIIAYWLWRWIKESNAHHQTFMAEAAESDRRFEETRRANDCPKACSSSKWCGNQLGIPHVGTTHHFRIRL
jgi:hypothetical protein